MTGQDDMSTQDKLAEALRAAREWMHDDKWRCSTIPKHKSWEAMIRGIDAALTEHDARAAEAAQAQAQSGEWVMVPRTPTEAMMEAAFNTDDCPDGPSSTPDFNAAYVAMLAAAPQQAAEPVATITGTYGKGGHVIFPTRGGLPIGTKLYTRPQPAQDASNPLKGWIFDKVNMGRGDERYICTPDGANATTVRNESTSDHRERLLWLIADAMVKESGR